MDSYKSYKITCVKVNIQELDLKIVITFLMKTKIVRKERVHPLMQVRNHLLLARKTRISSSI